MNESPQQNILLIPLLCGLFAAVLVLLSLLGDEKQSVAPAMVSAALPALSLAEPLISAEAYIVRFAGSDTPLIGRRMDKPVAPASLTKIMTAVIAAEKLAPMDTGMMTAYAKNVEERKSNAKEGDEFLRDDLIRMALAVSANDAALALAEGTGWNTGAIGSLEQVAAFVQLMNTKARILGMTATHFENPTGLDMPRHLASARDLALLAEYVLARHPQFWAMTREPEAAVATTEQKTYALENSNDLLKEFPALIGGKTGLTDNAKEALLLLYPVKPNKIALIVILRSDDRFDDGRKIIQWLEANCLASRGDLGERPCEP